MELNGDQVPCGSQETMHGCFCAVGVAECPTGGFRTHDAVQQGRSMIFKPSIPAPPTRLSLHYRAAHPPRTGECRAGAEGEDPGRRHAQPTPPTSSPAARVPLVPAASPSRAATREAEQCQQQCHPHLPPYPPPPTPAPSSQPQLQPGLLLEAREGLPSPAGQATSQQSPPQALLGRRPDWAAA